jgi:hypothetical protein
MNKLRNSTEWQSVPIDTIKPYARHARRHSKRTIEKIKKIIGRYGQVAPIRSLLLFFRFPFQIL